MTNGESETPAQSYAWAPAPPAGPRRARRRRRAIILAVLVVAILAVIGVVIGVVVAASQPAASKAPHPGMALSVPSDTAAAKASATAPKGTDAATAAAYLAAQPTAVWLTPEHSGIGAVGATVAALLDEAKAADAALTLVVYGLPERDCGQYSAGGLAPADYETWVAEIGTALKAVPEVTTIVMLEPDSLALAPQCGNVDARVTQLQSAIGDLVADNTWIYLDGGHSSWLPADQMADLLRQAGVERVRGFATNVSNYNALGDEVAYAHKVSALLDGAHAVIDTSRNGAGSNGEWCNPSGRLIGEAGGTSGDDVVDLNLWIKPPGESDGTCNGGPAAGTWWAQSAVELTRNTAR
ncbi:glycoside hydrolase family 6 protein [Microbacterium rhizomatis]|uniref:glycoside hydrolase family 6 protein n=1 Tax=Microbacterium rhizomatis TaxID=1631477 RepID=UPI001FE9204E|nr:glycoside hydrolase family 6 protein [Microbacterium rhizomatis]